MFTQIWAQVWRFDDKHSFISTQLRFCGSNWKPFKQSQVNDPYGVTKCSVLCKFKSDKKIKLNPALYIHTSAETTWTLFAFINILFNSLSDTIRNHLFNFIYFPFAQRKGIGSYSRSAGGRVRRSKFWNPRRMKLHMKLRDIIITTGGILGIRLILGNFSHKLEKDLFLKEKTFENLGQSKPLPKDALEGRYNLWELFENFVTNDDLTATGMSKNWVFYKKTFRNIFNLIILIPIHRTY